jgi:hypothetical protein
LICFPRALGLDARGIVLRHHPTLAAPLSLIFTLIGATALFDLCAA